MNNGESEQAMCESREVEWAENTGGRAPTLSGTELVYRFPHQFLSAFDNYAAARDRLSKTPEGSDEERLCIAACADSWARLVSARASLPSASTD